MKLWVNKEEKLNAIDNKSTIECSMPNAEGVSIQVAVENCKAMVMLFGILHQIVKRYDSPFSSSK